MIWNRLIKVGATLYLTNNGLVGGTKLITSVDGLPNWYGTHGGPIILAIDGTVHEQTLEIGKGHTFSISTPMNMTDTLITSLITLYNTSKSTNADTRIALSGGPEGSKTYDCRWGHPPDTPAFEHDGVFIDTGSDKRVQGFRMNFTVSAIV